MTVGPPTLHADKQLIFDSGSVQEENRALSDGLTETDFQACSKSSTHYLGNTANLSGKYWTYYVFGYFCQDQHCKSLLYL